MNHLALFLEAVRLSWSARHLDRETRRRLLAMRYRALLYRSTGLNEHDAAAAALRESPYFTRNNPEVPTHDDHPADRPGA